MKKYIGRQLRPSQLAAELLPPDQMWCTVCHQAVERQRFREHAAMLCHRLGRKKMKKLKCVSLNMWERHRGAALDHESAHEGNIEHEFEHYQADQRRREQMLVETAWGPSRPPSRWDLF
ncbi:conserved hypothetical protein [Leishmania braziliensis MHOM/BR/75/M2904]|uniref:Uncharacterized protein n=2 Tax=Leishmania braziliensis TaxID=5660 RepID=A4HIC2_LEIBR|nr:conserved hypothetical protein [Leishmania braziliensis MHOM/BR/75/M2904]KAI5689771.1 hypothetical protein MNV84_05940 [Leishmania braziliensis]CAJ2477239.1 unnamed protein product [Leishmania braziliensis]CAJ2477671.1 unnamed protein product [Leishmania braziliensis]CAM40332.1 conserved hypothetical protein [Leishmania braziliensis MHOM/BR/75/M2904]SYZ68003.1 hypothetical_protein [Leishmania braziliensis MHOM/BR/75/M2904]